MNGKTIFIWKVKDVYGGDPKKIAARAKEMGLTAVLVKAANWVQRYNLRPPLNLDNIIGPLIEELSAVGIDTYGWQYIYGDLPEQEAARAIERIQKYSFKGWIIDAEGEYEAAGMAAAATRYMIALGNGLPSDYPIGLTTYRYPNVHEGFPWRIFLPQVDFYMPQVYWMQAHDPAYQLDKSLTQYRKRENELNISPKPYYPVGAAFYENGWQPTLDEIKAFHAKAIDLGLNSVCYWEWSDAILRGIEPTLAELPWPGYEAPTWKESITAWARSQGYVGPGPGVDA